MEGRQRVRLVSRPMQQNIFWDESEGRLLDVRELLQPSPQLTDQNMGDTMSDKPLIENGIPPEVKDQKCRGLGKECCHKNSLNSPRSRTNLDKGVTGTLQRNCNANMLLWHSENEYRHYSGSFMKIDLQEGWEITKRPLQPDSEKLV